MINSILPGTDNFFKYLLTIGLVLILFALVYPLKKEQELKIEAIELLKKNDELKNDIEHLAIQSKELSNYKDAIQKQIDTLNKLSLRAESKDLLDIQKQKIDLKNTFDEKKEKILMITHDLEAKNIALKFEQDKHIEINRQIWDYAIFKVIFWVVGLIFCAFGFLFWMGSAYIDDVVKGGGQIGTGYRTYYVRCLDYVRRRYIVSIIILVIILIISYFLFRRFTAE